MGTRSLTFVYDDGAVPVLNMYRQFDGYPTGHGMELAEFLNSKTLVNGFGSSGIAGLANGMCCLAAQMIAHFKDGVGGIYIYNVKSTDCGQDYEYHVYKDRVTVKDYTGKAIFTGPWLYFRNFCKHDGE